ncbi:serpin family protein [Streptomyces sp. ODS28]|uniref:serpin family protein n=1 Tax=Streptomyces sp. ODS28 TaxID=3136688 RepID=UPI0031EED934
MTQQGAEERGGYGGPGDAATVRSVNEMTARWAQLAAPGGSGGGSGGQREGAGTVFTAAGLWPLLAGLAAGGDAQVRRELAGVLEVDPDRAADLATGLMRLLNGIEGMDAALGLWARASVEPEKDWVSALPYGTHGELTGAPQRDRERLDAWASEHTAGRIRSMPVVLEPATLLVLASALVLNTTWEREFTAAPRMMTEYEPWMRRPRAQLSRAGTDLDELDVADTAAGAVTRLTVRGDTGVDVQLLLGAPEMAPGAVLAAGARMPYSAPWIVPGSRLPFGTPGPGVSVAETPSFDGTSVLSASLPPFTVEARHDLLADAAEFGLATAAGRYDEGGHFPGISRREPLAVGSAQQSVTATFSAKGFYAAAVTAVGMVRAAGLPPQRARSVAVRFDRPFGFVAVHRATGLILTAGWVTEPDPAQG